MLNFIQKPDSISLVGNMNHVVIAATGDVTLTLSLDGAAAGDNIFVRRYTPDANGRIEVNLYDAVYAQLAFVLSDTSAPYYQTGIVKTFRMVVAPVSGSEASDSWIFTAIRAGIDNLADTAQNFLAQNFLTWQPTVKGVTYYTPEFLTYFNPSEQSVNVKIRAHIDGETELTYTLTGVGSMMCLTIPTNYATIAAFLAQQANEEELLPQWYDIWVENSQQERLTYIQRYYAQNMQSEEEEWILFENSLGGIDTFRAYGDAEHTAEHTHNVAEIEEVSEEYRVDTNRKHKKNTGHLDNYERRWLLDFFPSTRKYIYTAQALRQIVVTESNVSYKQIELPSSYSFTYKYADAKPYLNLPRTEMPLQMLSIDMPELSSFTVAPRLVEFPRTQLSDGALFPVQAPYSESWGATTFGAIFSAIRQLLGSSYGGDGGIGHTHDNISFLDSLSWESILQYVGQRFLSKTSTDVAQGKITFAEGLISFLRAEFGEYVRSAGTNTGAAILPDGTGDFINLVVKGIVSGGLDIRDLTKVVDMMFTSTIKSKDAQGREARKGFTDGYGVYIDALEGLIQTDGLEVRGFMRVMELVINRLQLMESDYSFTEGGTVEHIDVTANAQQMVFLMHKEHDNDTTPFYPGDILYAKVNDLLSHGSYYTAWVRVVSVDQTENTLTVVPYVGKLSDNTPVVPGSKNFTPLGTEITTEYLTALQADLTAYPNGYDKPMNLTRHGNVADGIDPATGQPSASILASQKGRQQSWVLSATDKRLSFFWNVDTPIIRDENYALCLGILPDLANLPSTRDRNMPSLYVNTVFFDHSHRANFPAQEVKTDRGAWTATPTALYDGSEVSDPYHYRHINQPTWLTYRNSPSWQSLSDAELLEKINTEFKEDLETSRVWRYGILWECLTEGTTEAPGYGCEHWSAISGDTTFALEFSSSRGLSFRIGYVNTVITCFLAYGMEDITAKVAAEHWTWERSSENGTVPQDATWNAQHAHQKTLTLTSEDMPPGWSTANKAIFTCKVQVGTTQVENAIIA